MVRGARLVAARASDRAAGEGAGGKVGAADRADRRGQDARRLHADADRSCRPAEAQARRGQARHPHALHLAAEGARRRHRAQPHQAGRRDGPAVDAGDAHRRHARAQAPAPEARAARHIAHHARATGAADRDVGRKALLRGSALRRLRRAAFAGDLEARASAVAGPGAAARHRARPAGDRPVGDGRRSGRVAPLAGGAAGRHGRADHGGRRGQARCVGAGFARARAVAGAFLALCDPRDL